MERLKKENKHLKETLEKVNRRIDWIYQNITSDKPFNRMPQKEIDKRHERVLHGILETRGILSSTLDKLGKDL